MAVPFCPGEVVDVAGAPACQDEMGAPLAWESYPTFAMADVDPAIAGSAFAGGFVIVGMAWALGRATRAVLGVLK